MRVYVRKSVPGVLAVCLAVLVAAPSMAVVPFYDNFEAAYGHADGQALEGVNGWTASSNVVEAQSGTAYDSLSAEVPVTTKETGWESATNACGGGGQTNVWVDFYTRPSLYTGDEANRTVDATASALFFFSTNRYAVVHDGSATNWVEQSGGTQINTNAGEWQRVTVWQNYNTDKWALFVNDELLDSDIDQTYTAGTFERLVIEDNTFLDNLWISDVTFPDGIAENSNAKLTGSGDGDGVGDAYELALYGNLTTITSGNEDGDADGDTLSALEEFETGSWANDAASAIFHIPWYEGFENVALGAISASDYDTLS